MYEFPCKGFIGILLLQPLINKNNGKKNIVYFLITIYLI